MGPFDEYEKAQGSFYQSNPFDQPAEAASEAAPQPLSVPNEPITTEKKAPSLLDTYVSSAVTSLPYVGVRRAVRAVQNTLDAEENYNANSDPYMVAAHEDDKPDLSNAKSHNQLVRDIQDRWIQRSAKDTLGRAGFWNNVVGYSAANPWAFLLPGFQAKAALTAGKGILTGLGAGVATGVGQGAFEQGLLYTLLETQTADESVQNVIAQSLVSGLLGSAAGAAFSISGQQYAKSMVASMKGLSQKFRVNDQGIIEALEVTDNSSGASKHVEDIVTIDTQMKPTENPFEGRTVEGEGLYQSIEYKGFGPASPLIWLNANMARNPFLLAKYSPSVATQSIANDFLSSNLRITKVEKEGIVQAPSLQELIGRANGENVESRQFLKDAYKRYLKENPENAASQDDFNAQMQRALYINDHPNPSIAAQAREYNQKFNRPIEDELRAEGYSLPDSPYGAVNHLTRDYDVPGMIATQPEKIKWLNDAFGRVNEQISEIRRPIVEAEQKIEMLKGSRSKANKQKIKDLQQQIQQAEEQIEQNILQDKYDRKLLVGDRGMSWKEIQQLTSLRKAIDDAKASGSKDRLSAEREKINQGVRDGEIPQSLVFKTEKGNYRLRKVNRGTRKLGEILSPEKIYDSAYKTFLNITHLSPDQLAYHTAGGLKKGSAGPTLTQARVLLEDDVDLFDAGFLRKNLPQNLSAKNTRARRFIEINRWFKANGWDGIKDQKVLMAEWVERDYKELRQAVIDDYAAKIEKNPEQSESLLKKQGVELTKLEKRQKLDTKINNTIYNRLTGAYEFDDGAAVRSMNILKKWAYSTQLLANVIPGLNDFGSGIYNHGIKDHITHGAIPFIADLATMWKKGDRRVKANLRGLNIGVQVWNARNVQNAQNSIDYSGIGGWLVNQTERRLDQAARAGQVLGLAAPATDIAQQINGYASQSVLIRDLKLWQKGRLSKAGKQTFEDFRFDPNKEISGGKLGDVILEQFKTHGERLAGGNILNDHLWQNVQAVDEVGRFTRRQNEAVIFAGNNPASFPLEVKPNGIASGLLMYMGYSFQAVSNFTIPLLQKFDSRKVQGIAAILAISALQDPLRKLSRGVELTDEDFEPLQIFQKAVQNSGLLGGVGEYFNRLNAIFDFAPALQTEKHRYHNTFSELIVGPPGALVQNAGELFAAGINNEWNKGAAKNLPKVAPLLNLWWLRQPYKEYLEETDLPKTRANARALNE